MRVFLNSAARLVALGWMLMAAFPGVFLATSPASAQFSAAYELIKAVEEQDYAELRTQMLKCRCPNVRTIDDVPVLVIAARNADKQIVEYLLESGANPNAADRTSKMTPLMEFARRGDVAGLNMLLARNADLDAGNDSGQTALMIAVRSRQARAVKALLDAGANVDMPDYQGQTALDVARSMRLRDLERLLMDAS
ncbi:hypothetical protein JCM17845_13920 [Iodidimonas gelatinilytica]|uniref:Uncharacterized protein n=1 Tax=Iodidimonas gelatinilytica TaxID=1236966 RepID=A0A5A7N0T6_9PROT|nr:ankyrin repeat domain-containing protein [Iodidimonas gelatinilytica]GER00769.1 hypothetical protein JCM17845_13920 [Iodidimonas gelatinilytica]